MKASISRRSWLAGAGYALAGTAAGQMLLGVARAQDAAPPPAALCMTMLFMSGARAKFETDKYIKRHLPLLREVYADSVERIEVRTTAGAAMGVPPAILASVSLWIRDVAGFSQRLAANAGRINQDLDGVSRGNRLAQVDRVALELGEARDSVSQNDHVFSVFYPSSIPARGQPAEASFDARYFIEAFLPKMYALYGSNIVRRVEATQGQDQGGEKAANVAAYHLVIRDRNAWDGKATSVFGEMQKDAGKFTNIMVPLLADMRVNAVA